MQGGLEDAAIEAAVDRLRGGAEAIFARLPMIDPDCPETSDLDLLVFGDVDDLRTERLRLDPKGPMGPVVVDILRVPAGALDDPARFARKGLMPHRLLGSKAVFDPSGRITRLAGEVAEKAALPGVRAARIVGILNFGSDVVAEIGVTRGFPGLARFWL